MFAVAGNLIIILTLVDSHLKTPMYIFLRNFSTLQIMFTTVCVPRFLYSMTTGDKSVTYNACVIQLFFVILIGATEFFLLTAMSYDRYVAFCKPLHYTTIMNERVCTVLLLCCWLIGLLVILPPLSLGVQLDFCNSNLIDHFGCDASPLLKIVCSDTQFVEQLVLIMAVLTLILTLVCVIVSYTYIIKTILTLLSAQQKKKAFSTCSSHMIVVSITYGSCIFIYIKPAKEGVAINKQQLSPQPQRTQKQQGRRHTQLQPPGCSGTDGHRKPGSSGSGARELVSAVLRAHNSSSLPQHLQQWGL
ncbi:olfactory receptor 6C2 [Camelus ferus]|nr:olfactory receptor 6C2 [Camelus ferus]